MPLGKSFALWIVLVVIVAWDYTNNQWFSLIFIDFTTYLSHWISTILTIPSNFGGKATTTITTIDVVYRSIIINGYPMMIEIECSAYHAYLALFALVIFSHWTIKQKLSAGIIMFIILAVINSLRIIVLGLIGKKFPQFFDILHDYIWNILLVIVIWGMWELVNQKIIKQKTK